MVGRSTRNCHWRARLRLGPLRALVSSLRARGKVSSGMVGGAAYTETVQGHTTRRPGASDEAQALLEEVAQVVHARLPPGHRAVLFGSRATGAARLRSDWDIGIIGPAPVDGAIVERIREALENLPTLSMFDVVDLASVPDRFRERALREGVAL